MSPHLQNRIIVDKQVCHGKPCIRGTRIMVTNILSLVAGGYDIARILKYYPEITEDDVRAALEYTIETVQGEDIQLLST